MPGFELRSKAKIKFLRLGSRKGNTQAAEGRPVDGYAMDKIHVAEKKGRNLVTAADQESGQKDCSDAGSGTRLVDLPECSIISILCLTTPRDVARLACVHPSFRAAAYSDTVWLKMLPPSYAEILAQASVAPDRNCSKKELYDILREGVLLKNRTRSIWLDRATGAVCQSIGARGLDIYSACYPWCQLGHFHRRKGSRFREVARIRGLYEPKMIAWMETMGNGHCSLSPGTYILSWRLCLCAQSQGPVRAPTRFSDDGSVLFCFQPNSDSQPLPFIECSFNGGSTFWLREQLSEGHQQSPLGYRRDPDGWMELDFGRFIVESEDSQIQTEFGLSYIASGGRDLFFDGIMIRPAFVIPNRIIPFEI